MGHLVGPMEIAATLQSTEFVALTLYKCAEGYQANLQSESGAGWRISIASTPDAAVCDVLRVPAPAVPPCPVPLIPPPPC